MEEPQLINGKRYRTRIILKRNTESPFCSFPRIMDLVQALAIFFSKDPLVSILGFTGHRTFVTTTQFCWYSSKADIDNTERNSCGCFPVKPSLQKQEQSGLGSRGHCSVLTPDLDRDHQRVLTSIKRETIILTMRSSTVQFIEEK